MRKLLFTCAVVVLIFCIGCNAAQPDTPAVPENAFSEVFNDGLRIIEAGRLIRLPAADEGREYCFLELRITNNDITPIYYSSMLCLSVSSGGSPLSTENAPAAIAAAKASFDNFTILDGTIESNTAIQGFIFFEAPVGTNEFDISIASNFCRDEWLDFSCSVV